MNPATETYFFSTTISGNGVLDEVFHLNQVDGRMPVINELSNVLLSAAQVTGDGIPFQGDASVRALNVFSSGDPCWLISGRSSGPAQILMLPDARGPAWRRRGCQHESLRPGARDR
jgi:hypothetical protein